MPSVVACAPTVGFPEIPVGNEREHHICFVNDLSHTIADAEQLMNDNTHTFLGVSLAFKTLKL